MMLTYLFWRQIKSNFKHQNLSAERIHLSHIIRTRWYKNLNQMFKCLFSQPVPLTEQLHIIILMDKPINSLGILISLVTQLNSNYFKQLLSFKQTQNLLSIQEI